MKNELDQFYTKIKTAQECLIVVLEKQMKISNCYTKYENEKKVYQKYIHKYKSIHGQLYLRITYVNLENIKKDLLKYTTKTSFKRYYGLYESCLYIQSIIKHHLNDDFWKNYWEGCQKEIKKLFKERKDKYKYGL